MAKLFVTIMYGDNEELLINPRCRQLTFMGYLREKCQYDSKAFIDLLDETGKLANVHMVDPQENLDPNFTDRLVYIPVMLEKRLEGNDLLISFTEGGEEKNQLKMIKPLLTDWEKKFPNLERKIKILTGELKRKKSPGKNLLETRGRGLDRKNSTNRSDGTGRSSSNIGRPSSINQSGRLSTTNAGKQSSTGRKSIAGGKIGLDGGKGSGKKGKKK